MDESTTQGGGTSSRGAQNDKSIVPVLIKHITSTTGDLQVAGRTVNTLSVVGIIRRIEQDTTKISFTIQDDTGISVHAASISMTIENVQIRNREEALTH